MKVERLLLSSMLALLAFANIASGPSPISIVAAAICSVAAVVWFLLAISGDAK